jgi:CRP-like cAMP-binding protein
MFDALTLLSELDQRHVDWIFDTGIMLPFKAGTPIIGEGTDPDSLYFVMEGLVGIYVSSFGDKCLAALGPGEILGDISFLEDIKASSSVIAVEDSRLLAIRRDMLESKIGEDLQFAAQLYRTFAVIASRRLRKREKSLGNMLQNRNLEKTASTPAWKKLSASVEEFKDCMHRADRQALKNNGAVPDDLVNKIEEDFSALWEAVNLQIGDSSAENTHAKSEIGVYLQRELLPYLMLARTAERICSRPRGYAVDYQTVEWIYANEPGGSGRVGTLLDRCFLKLPVMAAMRNRRVLMAGEILDLAQGNKGPEFHVACLGCGPAEELFDAYAEMDSPSRLFSSLIDMDLQALSGLSSRVEKGNLGGNVNLINGNLLSLAAGKHELDVRDQDLVYSLSIIDSLPDRLAVSLMNHVHTMLHTRGTAIFGCFHTSNPGRAGMDYLLDWRPLHRNEQDMNRLFESSYFGKPCSKVRLEERGVWLLARCSR